MKILIAADGSDFSKGAIDVLANIVGKPDNTNLKIISAFDLVKLRFISRRY